MSIHITCKACSKQFKVKDDLANRKIRCPFCSGRLDVPGPQPDMDGALQAEETGTGFRVCPACAEKIRAGAKKCRFCGEILPGKDEDSGTAEFGESLWESLSDKDLSLIEAGASPFDADQKTPLGEEAEAVEPVGEKPPAEHQERRREIKKYMRELARLEKWVGVCEVAEVREALKKAHKGVLEKGFEALNQAKKQGAVTEELTKGGEVKYRFIGEKANWTLPREMK
ncbi:MAG: hypothetical protein V2A58_12505 [Planctomycetota bacterium]